MTYNEERQPLITYNVTKPVLSIKRDQKRDIESLTVVTSYRYRVFFGLLCSLAFVLNSTSRGIMAVTIVAMTNKTVTDDFQNETEECPDPELPENTSTVANIGEFNWDSETQGFVLSSFAYGFTFTQIPAGILAGKYGGKKLTVIGIFGSGFLSFFVPAGARVGVGILIAIQVVSGGFLGLITPAMMSMIGRKAPVMERSFLTSLAYMGSPLGTVFSQSVSGVVSNSQQLGGWPTVFYGYGVLALIWCIPWCLFVKDTPPKFTIPDSFKNRSTPYLKILTSGPVWAIYCAHFAYGWVFFTMVTFLPTYLSSALKFDISQNGIISSIPFLCCCITQGGSGYVVDFFRHRGVIQTLTARRLCVTLNFIGSGIPLVTIYYAGCDKFIVVVILSISLFFCGFCVSGFLVNGIDIASNYSGQIMGISNALSTSAGIIAPTLIGFIIKADPTRFGWHIVFLVIAGVNVFGTLSFFALGKGEELSWNREDEVTFIVQKNEVYVEE